jgi:hypothetical protein
MAVTYLGRKLIRSHNFHICYSISVEFVRFDPHIMLFNAYELRENRRREGHTLLMAANENSFTRLSCNHKKF